MNIKIEENILINNSFNKIHKHRNEFKYESNE